ncbi:MAG: hypothetical protein KF712_16165 [Akkermansiaceae bacterium]|nr:hypothetical protein [Akkermansiaceae bacterium]
MHAKSLLACLGLTLFPLSHGSAQDDSPPAVTASWINAGTPQRSMIQSIGVRFDRNVSRMVNAGSLKVRNIATGNLVDLSGTTLIYDPRNNSANWMVEKDRSALLPDGNYIAWIEIDTMLDGHRRDMNAAGGIPVDDHTFGFHQYSGDTDGDRDVDFRDASVLRETWQQSLGQQRFKSFLDFDLTDYVNEGDRGTVSGNYFTVLPPAPAIHLFLRNDTGDSTTDNNTGLYASAFGSVGASEAVSWRARLGNGTPADITALVSMGAAALDKAFIDQLNGAALVPGSYSLTVEALDAGGGVIAADTLAFDYSGPPAFHPHFITTPPPGVSLGQVQAAAPLNLSTWSVQRWPGSQGAANWVIEPDGLSVEQRINSAPSALISDQSFLNLRITGSFRVDTTGDDDFMGFIFGYQNSKQFYVFDWKQATQGSLGGTALRGMCIKRFDAGAGNFTEADFWWSNENRPNMTILSPPNDIPWVDFQEYRITLDFTPGRIVVEVRKDDGTLLDRMEVNDNTFTGGSFGFYNYSQDSVIYKGFTQEALNNIYFYDSEAVDPDGGSVTYSIGQGPPGATINATSGSLLWQPTTPGTFPFRIVATDEEGLTGTQEFDVNVTPVDEPPTVYISKTAPSVLPGEDISFRVIATDDQEVRRMRLFIDDFEVPLDDQGVHTTKFSAIGSVELKAVAIDSAGQTSSITSYIRVLDPNAPPTENPNVVVISPPGQTTGNPSDLRPLVSFQSPLRPGDNPAAFTGTVTPNGGTLQRWVFEWAPARTVDFSNLNSPAVLWQTIQQGTSPLAAQSVAVITPANYPDELIAFRLRAENTNGLGAMTSVVLNPRSNNISGPGSTTGTGNGATPLASFTSPLSVSNDPTLIRGTISANGGTLQSWVLDHAPRNVVDTANLQDPAVTWTILAQGTTPATNALLTTIDPANFPNQTQVFRLTAINTNGKGRIATLIYNPVASGYAGPDGSTGVIPANANRPVTRITSPVKAGDDRTTLAGTVSANGGTLLNWIVDYVPRTLVNPEDLNDPSVSWTELATGTTEKTQESLAPLTNPLFQTGLWIIRLRAFNTNGLGSLATIQLDTGDTSMPSVAFTAPAAESSVDYITDVRGTVVAGTGSLASWKLEIAPSEEVPLTNLNASANWVELGSGTTATNDQLLGKIDPTSLRNGSYVLRLKATNTNGRGIADGMMVHVSGEAKLGNFRLEFDDLVLPLAGIPIRINRIYDTLNSNRSGDFGYGWSLGIGDPDIRETVPDTGDSYFFATPFEIGTRVFLTTPEGRRVGFTFNARNPRNRFLYVDYEPYFEPDPGVYETLTIAPVDYERIELDASGAAYTPLLPFGYNPENYRLTTKDGLVYDYNQRTGLKKITDRNNQSVTVSRNAITHSSGESVAIARDSRGRVTSITAPGGAVHTYRYDANGDLVAIDDPVGGTTTLTYLRNPAHFLSTVANPVDTERGRFTRRVIYENGRFVRVEDADGNTISSNSVAINQFEGTRTDALGNVTTLRYDTRGNVVQETDPDGGTSFFEYADSANPDKETAITDANGNRTEITYDPRGNPVSILDAGGNRRNVAYNDRSQPTSLTLNDKDGIQLYTILAEYDARGNLVKFVNCSGQTRTVAYDTAGRPMEIVNFDGSTTLLTYASAGASKPSSVINAEGETKQFRFDSAGRIIGAEVEPGSELAFRYNSKGQLIEQIDGQGESGTFTYDANGNPTRVIDRLGKITEMVYDSSNRVIRETKIITDNGNDSDDLVTAIAYDAAGRITSVTDPAGKTTTYDYTPGGRVYKTTDSIGRDTLCSYDGNGNVTTITDRMGRRRTFEYDFQNRVTKEEWFAPGGTAPIETFTYEFNSLGRPLRLADSRTVLNYEYNCGRLSRQHNAGSIGIPSFDFSLTHGTDGRVQSITDQSGASVWREYDSEGGLTKLIWSGGTLPGSAVTYGRDSHGFVTEIARFTDGLASIPVSRSIVERDPFEGTVTRIQHLRPDGGLVAPGSNFEFDHGPDKRLLQQNHQGISSQYQYDNLGQLTGATHGPSALPDESYTHDRLGNRTNSHKGGATTVNALGLVTGNASRTYAHDAENNLITETDLTTGNIRRFTYDHRNRILSIASENSGGTVVSSTLFRYDPLDRLISRTVNGVNTFTTYWENNPWAETTPDGTVTARYLYDDTIDGLLARWTPGEGVEWMLTDHLRSVRYATDDNANVTATITYDSFGNPVTGEADLIRLRHGFTGREYLGGGLHHYRRRVLDSFTGRFLSDDPLGFTAQDFNFQRYVFNDPLGLIDPSGTISVSLPEVGFASSLQVSLGSRVLFTISFKAVAVNAAVGAVAAPLLDILCLSLTDEGLDGYTAGRFLRQAAIGTFTGGAGGAFGSAIGSVAATPAVLGAVNTIERISPTALSLLGNWLINIESMGAAAIAGRVGLRAAFTTPMTVEAGLSGEGCDSFFYNLIGGE